MADSGQTGEPRRTTRRALIPHVIEYRPSRQQSAFVRLEPVADAPRMSTISVQKNVRRARRDRHKV